MTIYNGYVAFIYLYIEKCILFQLHFLFCTVIFWKHWENKWTNWILVGLLFGICKDFYSFYNLKASNRTHICWLIFSDYNEVKVSNGIVHSDLFNLLQKSKPTNKIQFKKSLKTSINILLCQVLELFRRLFRKSSWTWVFLNFEYNVSARSISCHMSLSTFFSEIKN